VPLAGNTVTFAAQLKLRPGEAATVVLESTVFAVAYIPFVFWFTGVAQ
jgi:predicted permease